MSPSATIGGIRDQIRHEDDGWLFPLEDEDALAGYIRKAMGDRGALSAMGERARDAVVAKNGYAVVGRRFADLYADVLERFRAVHG